MRVLVVDDDHAVADSTAVLLDIGLKGMDGFETAQRLRQLPQGRGLRLVAVTGYADSAIRARARASGCDHFLVKPVTFKELNKLLSGMAGAAPAYASI